MSAWRHFRSAWSGAFALAAGAACATAPAGGNLPRAETAAPTMSADAVPASGAPAVPVVAADVPAARGEASAADPRDDLLEMAATLAHAESHELALRALEDSAFAADLGVTMARADLLRDLGRRNEALAVLRGVRERLGAAGIDPRVLFEIAELERLEGERPAARRTIAAIRALHGDAEWTRANAARLALVDGQLAAAEPVRSMAARDLLGNLRGAPEAGERLAALRALLDGVYADANEAAAVRERAVAIAVGDPAESVRQVGVQSWSYDAAVGRDFVALALVDASPLVRRAAVAHAAHLPPAAATALLFQRLQQEADAAVFQALHDALRAAVGGGAPIAPLDAATAEGRAEVVAQWRRAGVAAEGS